jgi:capsular exopolysaccharide synthesis family protein
MNNLEKYLDQVIEQKPVGSEPPAEIQEPPTTNVLDSLRKRWPIILVTAIVICAVGLPAIWFLVEPMYVVQGSVKIKQAVPSVLTGKLETGEAANYALFVNTQVQLMMTDPTSLQGVLDELVPRNLAFFSGQPRNRIERLIARVLPSHPVPPEEILRRAIANREIAAVQLKNTELVAVTMKDYNLNEAKTIVNTFLRIYVNRSTLASKTGDAQSIAMLENQLRELNKEIEQGRNRMRAAAEQNAATVLDPNDRLNQELVLNRLGLLQRELLRLEALRVQLEGDILTFDPNTRPQMTPEQTVAARMAYVSADPRVKELTTNVVAMERDLIVARQTQLPAYPALQQKEATLEALKQRLKEREDALAQEFDSSWQKQRDEVVAQRKKLAPEELRQIEARIAQVKQMLEEQNQKLTDVAKSKLGIQGLTVDLALKEEMRDQVVRRIDLIKMEQQRAPQVIGPYDATLVSEEDKRPKMAGAGVFAARGCGVGRVFLRDKMDKTLQTPSDITRQTELAILGTTTSSRTIKPALFAEQIAGDYQTIRTNLGLLYNGGMPKRLVISSAGMREGKTTFAVNLATSLAKSGKKVLLIDGDLRKPDIGHMLNVLNCEGGLQNVLLGEDPAGIVCVMPTSGLHVLAANPRYLGDAYELLTSSTAADQMERLTREYDHIIVDSPPTLAFPDALVWAKLTDAVILVSFAGQTTGPDLKEAKERFARIRVRVLGAVLSNVPADQGLYHYTCNYRSRVAQPGRPAGKPKKMLLTSTAQGGGEHPPEA